MLLRKYPAITVKSCVSTQFIIGLSLKNVIGLNLILEHWAKILNILVIKYSRCNYADAVGVEFQQIIEKIWAEMLNHSFIGPLVADGLLLETEILFQDKKKNSIYFKKRN